MRGKAKKYNARHFVSKNELAGKILAFLDKDPDPVISPQEKGDGL